MFRAGLTALLFFCLELRSFLRGTLTLHDGNRHHASMTSPGPIESSFELAAARCEDLTPLVYRRLFDLHPEAEAMFRTEGSDAVKGSMLALTIDAILDFAGDRSGPYRLIECETSSHDAYGTPRQLFGAFFRIIADTLRDLLGALWSREIDSAWRELLIEIDGIIAGVET